MPSIRAPSRRAAAAAGVRRRAGRAAAVAAALLLAGLPAPSPAVGQAGDSADRIGELRDLQRDFERHRRRRFPTTGAGARTDCDERVGRYCLFHDDGDGWEPPPEDPDVADRRDRLLGLLADAAAALPGDAWIAGQRVRYLVEAGRPGEGAAAARACRAEAWWCTALEAFAHHHAGASGAADSAFAASLRRMPDDTRRRWLDPTVFLEDEAAEGFERRRGGARRRWLARLWWLSDPLWSVAGRGRRSAHLARRVRCRLQRDAAGPYGTAWGDDLEELTLRYGWPVGWQRVHPGHYGLGADTEVVAHHAPWARAMVPPAAVLEDPYRAGPGSWPLDPEEPVSEYGPPHLDTLARPAVRWSRFPRPDSLQVVAAWRWEEGEGAVTSLRIEAAPDGPGAASTGRQRGATGRLDVAFAPRPGVASLELLRRDRRRAARDRRGIRPPDRPEGRPGISDLLLTEPSERTAGGETIEPGGGPLLRRGPEAVSLPEAAARARPPGPAAPGERVGLYWEAYGPSALLRGGRTEVRLAGEGGGLLEGLARGLGLADDPRDVSVSWATVPAENGRIHPGGVVLVLPSDLETGRYRLEVTVRPPGREPLAARTFLRVEEASDRGG